MHNKDSTANSTHCARFPAVLQPKYITKKLNVYFSYSAGVASAARAARGTLKLRVGTAARNYVHLLHSPQREKD